MRWFHRALMKMRLLLFRGRSGAELDNELQFHLDAQIAEFVAGGMDRDEARRAALRALGNPALLRDQTRATWSWNRLESFLRDLRIAARTLWRTPGFTVIAIGVMALGIGANVALFTVVRGVLLKPLPFREPDRLLALGENTSEQFSFNGISGGVFAEWKKQQQTFTDLALLSWDDYNLSDVNGRFPEKLLGVSATWNIFGVLGVQPEFGRSFNAADDKRDASGVVLLTWGLWQRRFGGDRSILNQTIHLNGIPYRVIGVLPRWFYFSDPQIQIWTPIMHDKPESLMAELGAHNFAGVGRMKPGVTEAQARADLSVITRRLHDQHLDNPFVSKAAAAQPLLEQMVGDLKRPLYVLLAATGCVLLIACLNVANLLVARAAARRKDLAIRSALGGGFWRLLRERLLESLLLTAAGGTAGLALAAGAVEWFVRVRHEMTRVNAIHVDGAVAAFTLGVIAVCAIFAGLLSSLGMQNRALLATLQDSARGTGAGQAHARIRTALLGAEVGLTVVLLIGAGLLLKSYQRLRSSDMGCITNSVLTMRVDLFGKRYNKPAQLETFYRALLEQVRAIPGVQAAGFTPAVPGQGYWSDTGFSIVEHPPLPQGQMQFAIYREADPGFFAAMGIPFLRGHSFDPSGRLKQAIVNESFARAFLPGEDPIGKHLRINKWEGEIVGAVGDTRYAQAEEPKPIQYLNLYGSDANLGTLVIRSHDHVEQFAMPVQRIIAELDPQLPVSNVLTMDELLGRSAIDRSFNATLLGGFAALSLLLAAAGLFGVLSYIVAQRTGEIGIRIALGAQRGQVLRRVLVDGMRPALAGLLIGMVASALLVRYIESMLYKMQPLDGGVFGAVGIVLLAIATLACLAPAWRASRLDPMQALRTE